MEAGVCSIQEVEDTEKFLWPGAPQGPSWFHSKEREVKERSLGKDELSLTVPDSLTVRGCSISFLCPNFNIFIPLTLLALDINGHFYFGPVWWVKIEMTINIQS